jgi:hypothetical protein
LKRHFCHGTALQGSSCSPHVVSAWRLRLRILRNACAGSERSIEIRVGVWCVLEGDTRTWRRHSCSCADAHPTSFDVCPSRIVDRRRFLTGLCGGHSGRLEVKCSGRLTSNWANIEEWLGYSALEPSVPASGHPNPFYPIAMFQGSCWGKVPMRKIATTRPVG